MVDPKTQAAVKRLRKDFTRLKASAGYCAHFGTPTSKDNSRWNNGFAADIDTLLSALTTQAEAIADVADDLRALSNDLANAKVPEKFWRPLYERALTLEALSGQPAAASLPAGDVSSLIAARCSALPGKLIDCPVCGAVDKERERQEADVVALVIAGREAWEISESYRFEPDEREAFERLDRALEAFSASVPYEDDPSLADRVAGEEVVTGCDYCREGEGWKPVNTAPCDGKSVVLGNPEWDGVVTRAFYSEADRDAKLANWGGGPTVWMRPAVPATPEGERA